MFTTAPRAPRMKPGDRGYLVRNPVRLRHFAAEQQVYSTSFAKHLPYASQVGPPEQISIKWLRNFHRQADRRA